MYKRKQKKDRVPFKEWMQVFVLFVVIIAIEFLIIGLCGVFDAK